MITYGRCGEEMRVMLARWRRLRQEREARDVDRRRRYREKLARRMAGEVAPAVERP